MTEIKACTIEILRHRTSQIVDQDTSSVPILHLTGGINEPETRPRSSSKWSTRVVLPLEPLALLSNPSANELSARILYDSDRKSIKFYAWYTVIALVALLDFLAKVVADFVLADEVVEEETKGWNRFGFHRFHRPKTQVKRELLVDSHPILINFIQFLDKRSVLISVLFCLLWFMDAFVKATYKCDAKLIDLEKKHLTMKNHNTEAPPGEEQIHEIRVVWDAYFRTIMVQCLLLPISFFIIMHNLLSPTYSASAILLIQDEQTRFQFKDNNGHVDEIHSFNINLSESLLFVFLQYVGNVLVRVTGIHARAQFERHIRTLTKRLAFFAILKPKRFYRRVVMVLRTVRWLKYLTPLIGQGNTLCRNTIDLMKRHRQRRHAVHAERIRRLIWSNRLTNLPRDQLKIQAAIIVQRNFRRAQAAKVVRSLQLMRSSRTESATLRLQHFFRLQLASARFRILKKRHEFQELKQRMKHQRKSMTVKDRRRLFELQDELSAEASRLINTRMLIRPNTRFAVTWKLIFVLCVIVEISHCAIAPHLDRDDHHSPSTRMGGTLGLYFVPTPTAQLPECRAKRVPRMKATKGITLICAWLKTVQLRAHDWIANFRNVEKRPLPWYCQEVATTLQAIYIHMLKFTIHAVSTFVSMVSFVDVFMTFFTGELDPDDGRLVPKPFFERWILPGIALQLLVNPRMEMVGKYVRFVMTYAHQAGPVRIYRWAAAFFYPLFSVLFDIFIQHVWRPVVKENNEHPVCFRQSSKQNILFKDSRRGVQSKSNEIARMSLLA